MFAPPARPVAALHEGGCTLHPPFRICTSIASFLRNTLPRSNRERGDGEIRLSRDMNSFQRRVKQFRSLYLVWEFVLFMSPHSRLSPLAYPPTEDKSKIKLDQLKGGGCNRGKKPDKSGCSAVRKCNIYFGINYDDR